jgi:hypothetical protein
LHGALKPTLKPLSRNNQAHPKDKSSPRQSLSGPALRSLCTF